MRRVTVERTIRNRLRGVQVSPDAVKAIEDHVSRVIGHVDAEVRRTGAGRVTGKLVRRVLRRWDDEG